MTPSFLHIRNLTFEPPVMLAPMAGYTDAAFRAVCRRPGCSLTFTEVVNAEALLHDSRMTFHLLETVEDEGPTAAHVYGCKPDVMADAARIIEDLGRFALIDINAGCPVRKIVRKGCGVALMKDPALLADIVSAIRSAVSLPVTVKTRTGLGPEHKNISEIARAVEEAGADALFVHARLASKQHGGRADWDALARIKAERSIPVIGNGGVYGAADAPLMLSTTGVDGIMIGRAAIGNPWIFDGIHAALEGRPYTPPSADERRHVVLDHLDRLITLKDKEQKLLRRSRLSAETAAVLHFRGHLYRYLAGHPGSRNIRHHLETISTRAAAVRAIDAVLGSALEKESRGVNGPQESAVKRNRESALRLPE